MRKKIIPLLVILLAALLFGLRLGEVPFLQDDAFTVFRYAENFLEGKGLVFNAGERVEGYTSLMWVLLLSLGKLALPGLPIEQTAQFLSIASAYFALLLTFLFALKLMDYFNIHLVHWKYGISFSSLFVLVNSPPFIYWSVSGMETPLFAALTLLSIYLFLFAPDRIYLFAFVSVLNAFTRPEGAFIFSVILIFEILYNSFTSGEVKIGTKLKRGLSKKIILQILLFALPVAAYTAFRIYYYGLPLPNPFYAKAGFSLDYLKRGVDYFIFYAGQNLFYGLLMLPPLFLLKNKNASKPVLFFYFFGVLLFCQIILIGGDVLPVARFFIPFLPILFSFVALSIFQMLSPFLRIKYVPLLSTAIIMIGYGLYNYRLQKDYMMTKRSYEVGLVTKMRVYGEWIKKKQAEEGRELTAALSTIGSFAYYSDARVIDIVGLTDSFIARHPEETEGIDESLPVLWRERKYNARYVLERKPDYIIFPAGAKPTAFAECALFVQRDFYRNYYTGLIYSDKLNQLLPIFIRRPEQLELSSDSCSNRFVKNYILASNTFLEMVKSSRPNLLSVVLDNCDAAELLCPTRLPDIDVMRGISFYQAKDFENAHRSFAGSLKADSLNSIARFYMMNLCRMAGDEEGALLHYRYLKKFSPAVFENIFEEHSE